MTRGVPRRLVVGERRARRPAPHAVMEPSRARDRGTPRALAAAPSKPGMCSHHHCCHRHENPEATRAAAQPAAAVPRTVGRRCRPPHCQWQRVPGMAPRVLTALAIAFSASLGGAEGGADASSSTARFTRALAGASSYEQIDRLLRILESDPTIDASKVQIPRAGGPIGALGHVAKLHIFMKTGVNATAAAARGQDTDVALRMAQALLARGADATALDPRDCLSPLHYSTWAGDAALTRLLLARGARCDADMGLPGLGWTPLHLAVESDTRSTSAQLALYRSVVGQGGWVHESDWGIEKVPETVLGGPPLRTCSGEPLSRV